MYKIAVCDDESIVRDTLLNYLDRYAAEQGEPLQILSFSSANDLLADYPAGLDLLFLDIRMGGVDGMAAARHIRAFDERVCIIFITSLHQYALEGYSVRAFGFLKKPVSYSAFRGELSSALRHIQVLRDRDQTITLRSAGQPERLSVSRILYCEVNNHTVRVHLTDGVRTYRCSMKELEALLAPHGFFRCHAAFLVNSAAIDRIDAASLTLTDGSMLPVSQHRRREFLAALSRYLGGQM